MARNQFTLLESGVPNILLGSLTRTRQLAPPTPRKDERRGDCRRAQAVTPLDMRGRYIEVFCSPKSLVFLSIRTHDAWSNEYSLLKGQRTS